MASERGNEIKREREAAGTRRGGRFVVEVGGVEFFLSSSAAAATPTTTPTTPKNSNSTCALLFRSTRQAFPFDFASHCRDEIHESSADARAQHFERLLPAKKTREKHGGGDVDFNHARFVFSNSVPPLSLFNSSSTSLSLSYRLKFSTLGSSSARLTSPCPPVASRGSPPSSGCRDTAAKSSLLTTSAIEMLSFFLFFFLWGTLASRSLRWVRAKASASEEASFLDCAACSRELGGGEERGEFCRVRREVKRQRILRRQLLRRRISK